MKRFVIFSLAIIILLSLAGLSQAATVPVSIGVDMYALPSGSPARIASDSAGKVYVTDPIFRKVLVYSNNGAWLNEITGISGVLGVAVDSSGRVFISDVSNGSVGVYQSGRLLFKVGRGDGEFIYPNDIALSTTGTLYVTDSKAQVVKVFTPSYSSTIGRVPEPLLTGYQYSFSIGSGQLQYPTGIAVDDAAAEVYIIDFVGAVINVYDLAGSLRRTIRSSGGMMGRSKLTSPLGLAVDGSRLYVTDSFQSAVSVFDKISGVFLAYVGNFGTGLKEFRTPTDLAFDREGKLFVTNTNNQRIEVIGIDAYGGIRLDPDAMSFSVFAFGSAVSQDVNITSLSGDTSWTAAVSAPWIRLSALSGTTPSSVAVTVDPRNLASGNYSGQVTFRTSSGTEAVLLVSAQVVAVQSSFSAAPSSINLVYQSGSATLPSATVLVSSAGPVLNWSARTDRAWIQLSRNSGTTPASIQVSVTDAVKGFAAGSYAGSVVIDAGPVSGSPATVTVHLDVVKTGSVRVLSNLAEAQFSIAGPQNVTGGGSIWSADDLATGTYTITFNHISGYTRPYTRSFTVQGGMVTEIIGTYIPKPVATHILASTGDPVGNTVTVLTTSGVVEFMITPFDTASGVRAMAADLDADGVDEIVVSNTRNMIRVYNCSGTLLSSVTLPPGSAGLQIAAADTDGDGVRDVIAGYRVETVMRGMVTGSTGYLVSYAMKGNILTPGRQLLALPGGEAFSVAGGDINGDGRDEILIASKSALSAYAFSAAGTKMIWSRTLSEPVFPAIAAGDADDDGIDEVAVGEGADASNGSRVRILKGDGSDYGIAFDSFDDLGYGYGVFVSFGEIDGDGKAEVVVGAGPDAAQEALIRIYGENAQLIGSLKASDGYFGVSAVPARLVK